MGHCDNPVAGQVPRLRNPRMPIQVMRCCRSRPTNLAYWDCNERRVGEVANAERDVDAFIDQISQIEVIG